MNQHSRGWLLLQLSKQQTKENSESATSSKADTEETSAVVDIGDPNEADSQQNIEDEQEPMDVGSLDSQVQDAIMDMIGETSVIGKTEFIAVYVQFQCYHV